MDAADCEVTNIRRLDRYVLEHLFTLPRSTKLLLLVRVDDDDRHFKGRAAVVDEIQQLPRRFISGREYYQLKCSMDDVAFNNMVTGGLGAKMYSKSQFRMDVKNGRGQFHVKFTDTNEIAPLTWKDICGKPSTFMFFGAPLNAVRAYDSIFRTASNLDTLHRRFLCYWLHVEGDVAASLALINAYLSKRTAELTKRVRALEGRGQSINGGVFRSKSVVDFLDSIDNHCKLCFEAVMTEFKNHSTPIVELPDMSTFIEQAPEVFGDVWTLMTLARISTQWVWILYEERTS